MKKRNILLISLLLSLILTACGKAKESNTASTKDYATDALENTYIISINPQAMIHEDSVTGKILAVTALNEDAETYYKDLDTSDKVLSDVICDMVDICMDNNLLNEENQDVNIVVTKYLNDDESTLDSQISTVYDNVQNKYGDQIVITDSKAEDYRNPNPTINENQEIWITCPTCSYGIITCPVCNGDWEHGEFHEGVKCTNCENGIVTETETKEIYNGTPCQICGDVGTVDDGMHGGERAECGECRGYGASHSVGSESTPGGYNGDYASYAFDKQEITIENTCNVCNGTGFIDEGTYDPCLRCSHGELTCPSCEGHGGWNIGNAQ